ncbi:MAG: hypothetical protein ACKVJJ_01130, partial [Fidelibacterota bacterium]
IPPRANVKAIVKVDSYMLFPYATINTKITCLNMESTFRAIPFIRFEIIISVFCSIGLSDHYSKTNENEYEQKKDI